MGYMVSPPMGSNTRRTNYLNNYANLQAVRATAIQNYASQLDTMRQGTQQERLGSKATADQNLQNAIASLSNTLRQGQQALAQRQAQETAERRARQRMYLTAGAGLAAGGVGGGLVAGVLPGGLTAAQGAVVGGAFGGAGGMGLSGFGMSNVPSGAWGNAQAGQMGTGTVSQWAATPQWMPSPLSAARGSGAYPDNVEAGLWMP